MNLLDKSVPASKTILLLAWPTIMEQILQTMVSFVDTAMVGSIGPVATAAISVNTSTIWLVNGIMNAFSIGFSVLIAKNIGSRSIDQARHMARQCIIWTAVFGLALTAVMSIIGRYLAIWLNAEPSVAVQAALYMKWIAAAYLGQFMLISCSGILRSTGDTKTPLLVNILNNLANIVLNYFLIFETRTVTAFGRSILMPGAGMGVEGAAMATGAAAVLSAILLLCACIVKPSEAQVSLRGSWRPQSGALRTSLRLGTPVFLERITISVGQIALTAIVSSIGTAALAAHYVANTAESITYLPAYGFATAVTTLVAQSLGAGDKALARRFANVCTSFGVVTMTVTGAAMYIFAPQLVGIFSSDAEVIDMGTRCLRIEAFAEPFFALSILIFGVLRGSGDTKGPFLIGLAGMWGIRIPLAFILVRFTSLGLAGAWLAMMFDLMARGIFCFFRLSRGSWLDAFERQHI